MDSTVGFDHFVGKYLHMDMYRNLLLSVQGIANQASLSVENFFCHVTVRTAICRDIALLVCHFSNKL